MRDPPPKVSVAIWTCDQQDFIAETIDSALAQDYPQLEVVVADDHSGDETPRIVADYARRFPDVVRPLFNTGPRSILNNVNRALGACTGDLVAILDGDDLYLPGKVWAQVQALDEQPDVVLCHHPVEAFDTRTGETLRIEDPNVGHTRATAGDLVAKGQFIATASSMMRRRAMPPGGVPPVIQHAPDYLLAIETARHGSILRLPQVMARRRVHPGQITNQGARSDIVFRDAMRTLSYVEREYPELASRCLSGRREFTQWEADRRIKHGGDLRWINDGLRTALRYEPTAPWLWRVLISRNLRAARSRVARTGGQRRA